VKFGIFVAVTVINRSCGRIGRDAWWPDRKLPAFA
jgi:hypothetical protein